VSRSRSARPRVWLGALLTVLPGPLVAQLDYRNLDDDRPVSIEDAYPLERHAFELLTSWRYVRHPARSGVHLFVPELEYGILPNAHVGVKLPLAGVHALGRWDWGISGLRVFGLYNFNTESPWLPALSLRVDGVFPVGELAGDRTRVSFKGIATRSFGRGRVHLNGGMSVGEQDRLAAAEGAWDWYAGAAADHSFIRSSTLFVAELYAVKASESHPVEVNAAAGVRYQWTPYTVLDLGVARRLRREGPDFELTFGISRAFAIAGLLPEGGVR
jgi:hypothetical protein